MPEIEGVSAGGMPDRVKCLHVLAAHSLAQGRGVNPLGDEVLDRLGTWWSSGPCVRPADGRAAHDPGRRRRLRHQLVAAPRRRPRPGRGPDGRARSRDAIVRLGQGVDRTGGSREALAAAVFAAVDEYAAIVAEHDVDAIAVLRDVGRA